MLETILKEKVLAHLSPFFKLVSRQHGAQPCRATLKNLLVCEELVANELEEGSAVKLI